MKIADNITNLNIPEEIILIAVSKTKSSSMIREAYQAGQRDFGENYIQEAVEKIKELKDQDNIKWHFIGHLQSNKARLAAEFFDMVQSVDSIKLANKLNNACLELNKTLQILVEVNIEIGRASCRERV